MDCLRVRVPNLSAILSTNHKTTTETHCLEGLPSADPSWPDWFSQMSRWWLQLHRACGRSFHQIPHFVSTQNKVSPGSVNSYLGASFCIPRTLADIPFWQWQRFHQWCSTQALWRLGWWYYICQWPTKTFSVSGLCWVWERDNPEQNLEAGTSCWWKPYYSADGWHSCRWRKVWIFIPMGVLASPNYVCIKHAKIWHDRWHTIWACVWSGSKRQHIPMCPYWCCERRYRKFHWCQCLRAISTCHCS